MSPLPRTRTFDRRRPWTAWWIAVGMALITNLIVVVLLSQISNLQISPEPAPLITKTLRQLPPPPPPLPPPPPIREKIAQPVAKALAIPLPALDLPPVQPSTSLALPELPKLDRLLDLPTHLPAFDIASTTPTPEATLWPGPGEPDEAAQLESAFDLERFYPRIARLRGISGQTQVRLTIADTGHVLSAHVYLSTPPGVFEVATKELAQHLQFRPARLRGKAVASTKDIVIDWTLK